MSEKYLIPQHEITSEEAITLVATRWWEGHPDRLVALSQCGQDKLCMPVNLYHDACTRAAGFPISTHELGLPEILREMLETRTRRLSVLETWGIVRARAGGPTEGVMFVFQEPERS